MRRLEWREVHGTAACLACTVALATGSVSAAEAQRPSVEEAVEGIDVSHYSGTIDWQKVRDAGYDFAYVKATEGIDAPDPSFAGHWQELLRVGLSRGAYHFYVTEDDPEAQARFFLSVVDLGPDDLPPVVDIEELGHETPPGLADRLRTFLEIVERETGVKPIIYTEPNFWNANLGAGFADYPLWLAEYGVSDPHAPHDWEAWTMWQWEGQATLDGVEKDVDISRLHPEVALHQLRIPAVPSPAPAPDPPE
jgi:lysozyme